MKNLRRVLVLVLAICVTLSMLGNIAYAEETNEVSIPEPIFELDLSEYDGEFNRGSGSTPLFNTTAKNIKDNDIEVKVWQAAATVDGKDNRQDGSVLKHTLDSANGNSTDYLEMKAFRPTV